MAGRDHDTIRALVADDVVLHSPVSHRPYRGGATVGGLLCAAAEVLDDLTYGEELTGPEHTGLVFTATIGGRAASGIDLLVVDADGRVAELTITLRPLSAAQAFTELMGPRAAAVLGSPASSPPS